MVGRPKEFDPDAALNAALDAFWSNGFEGCSMAELLDEMAINRQSLYDTFGDKRELFLAVLAKYMERVGNDLKATLSVGKSPLGRIRNFLKVLAEKLAAGGGKGCLLTNTMVELGPHDAEIRKLVADRWLELEDALTQLLRQSIEVGEINRKTKARQVARMLLAVMQGAIVLAKADLNESMREAIKCSENVLKQLK
jgi:TetR/AcrR family transcriptional regulator, transcriptional repressor for nem operon